MADPTADINAFLKGETDAYVSQPGAAMNWHAMVVATGLAFLMGLTVGVMGEACILARQTSPAPPLTAPVATPPATAMELTPISAHTVVARTPKPPAPRRHYPKHVYQPEEMPQRSIGCPASLGAACEPAK